MFKFENGSKLRLIGSEEQGIVIGRAQFASSDDQYYLRYLAGDGRLIESWWDVNALEFVASPNIEELVPSLNDG